ncbi:MAG TPA: hypothetical protein VGX48_03805 [Pyrinomonadaceae bacterium]|jgi:hypothetical protein|nr:hypothetical protein [Pyrinomonadaceae bacterium]
MDKADIMKLDEAALFARLNVITDKIQRIDKDIPDNDDEPHIEKLLEEGTLICERLDPLMRERFRDNPAVLAEWDEIIHMCADIE